MWGCVSGTRNLCELMLTELEKNWKFMVEFYATFAPLGVPSLGKIKVPSKLMTVFQHLYKMIIFEECTCIM